MTALRSIPLECLDGLDQLEHELSVVWMALGNDEASDGDLRLDIREVVYGIRGRLIAISKAMEGGAK